MMKAAENTGKYSEKFIQGEKAYHSGNYKVAIQYLTEAIKLGEAINSTVDITSQLFAPWNLRGLAKDKLGQFKEAISDFDKAIELNPERPEVFCARASAKTELGLHEEAVVDYSMAISLDIKNSIAYNNRGMLQEELGNFEGAISDLDKAIELDPGVPAHVFSTRANLKMKLQRSEGAIADYDMAIALDPKDAGAFYNRGIAKSRLGRFDEAIIDFDMAIKLNPKNSEAFYFRGRVKNKLGRFEEAISDFDKAIKLNPKDAGAFTERASSKVNLGQIEGAVRDYNKAIALDPKNAMAWNELGLIKMNYLKRPEEAIAYFDKAIALDPKDANALANRGQANRSLDRLKEAIDDFERSLAIDPHNSNTSAGLMLAKMDSCTDEKELEILFQSMGVNAKNPFGFFMQNTVKVPEQPKKEAVPPEFRCPITNKIMKDPVMTEAGTTYERGAIENWFKRNNTDQQRGSVCMKKTLTPNYSIKGMILKWVEENPEHPEAAEILSSKKSEAVFNI